jgi:hypothetical protein
MVEIAAKVCARPGIDEDLCLSVVHPAIEISDEDLRALLLERDELESDNLFRACTEVVDEQ